MISKLLDVLAEGRHWYRDAINQKGVDQYDQFRRAVADDQVFRFDIQDRRKIPLTGKGTARWVRLDEIGELLLQIAHHRGGWVIGTGDETEINDFIRLFISH